MKNMCQEGLWGNIRRMLRGEAFSEIRINSRKKCIEDVDVSEYAIG